MAAVDPGGALGPNLVVIRERKEVIQLYAYVGPRELLELGAARGVHARVRLPAVFWLPDHRRHQGRRLRVRIVRLAAAARMESGPARPVTTLTKSRPVK